MVRHYTGELPIFESFDIAKQLKSLFGRTVSVKRGAYLIFDQAEAMHVIDVNSGTRTRAGQSQEENALEVNMASATEIARQLRLRDLGGIVVIDFIDMMDGENRQKLFDHMTALMANDRAKHNILPLSKFCLMQITRQRVRPAMAIQTDEVCPTCMGTGKARPAILLVEEIEEQLKHISRDLKIEKCLIRIGSDKLKWEQISSEKGAYISGHSYSKKINSYTVVLGLDYDMWSKFKQPINIYISNYKDSSQHFEKPNIDDISFEIFEIKENSTWNDFFAYVVQLDFSIDDENFEDKIIELIKRIEKTLKTKTN